MIEVTDWAREILGRSHAAATRFNPDVVIRLARMGGEVQTLLADRPFPSDEPVTVGDMTLYVEEGLEGLVDIEEPHDRIVLKPPGLQPNIRPQH